MQNPSVVRTSVDELRRIYRESGYEALVDSGQLTAEIETDNNPASTNGQPAGTRSQILAYTDSDGVVILRCHRYLRPDGSLGASGRPDPKWIFHGNVIYKQARDNG